MSERPLSLVFVTNNYKPYAGGVVRSIDAFCAQLRCKGHHVTIVTLDFTPQHNQEHENVIRIWCPVRFMYKKNHMALAWRSGKQIGKIINNLRPDIIHIHHPFLLGASALKVAQRACIPTVFQFHTWYEHYLHYIPLPAWLIRPFVRKRVRFFIKSVNGIIAPSLSVKNYVSDFLIDAPVQVIPSPIDQSYLMLRDNIGNQTHTFKLLCVSRFTKEKNIEFLLKACSQLNPARYSLTLVGYGAEFDALKRCAYQTLKLSQDFVRFIYKPTQPELIKAYHAADLFLFASRSDTQGIVLAEAMASGLPVVAVDGPGQRDIIQQGVNGFFVNDAYQMKNIIERIAHDNELYHMLRVNALRTGKRYAPEHSTSRLIDFYWRILAGKKSHS